YINEDNIKINNELSVGTIIKREAMKKQTNYRSLPPSDIALVEPVLQKINRMFNNPQNMEECYWKAKEYQRKASRFNEKIGYEVVSVMKVYILYY
ncbi:hypothetical protein BD408DRAFT_349608, partial [Parasitella parasitica]